MLEKSSTIMLTGDDLRQYNDGVVSERLKETWGPMTFEELKKLVESKQAVQQTSQLNSNNNKG